MAKVRDETQESIVVASLHEGTALIMDVLQSPRGAALLTSSIGKALLGSPTAQERAELLAFASGRKPKAGAVDGRAQKGNGGARRRWYLFKDDPLMAWPPSRFRWTSRHVGWPCRRRPQRAHEGRFAEHGAAPRCGTLRRNPEALDLVVPARHTVVPRLRGDEGWQSYRRVSRSVLRRREVSSSSTHPIAASMATP